MLQLTPETLSLRHRLFSAVAKKDNKYNNLLLFSWSKVMICNLHISDFVKVLSHQRWSLLHLFTDTPKVKAKLSVASPNTFGDRWSSCHRCIKDASPSVTGVASLMHHRSPKVSGVHRRCKSNETFTKLCYAKPPLTWLLQTIIENYCFSNSDLRFFIYKKQRRNSKKQKSKGSFNKLVCFCYWNLV